MSKALVYCRVSTDDQEKEGTSLTTQLEACQRYCKDRDYEILRTFTETYSGTTLSRPLLTEMRDLIRSGEADVLVIYCLDRLSRDPTHGVILFQELERLRVRLEAVTENVDSTEIGKLINYIRGFASKLEVEKIKERTTRGKAAHVRQGRLPTGTGIGPYGYIWDKASKTRVIMEEEAAVVRRIFSHLLRGDSLSQVARSLNHDGITTKAGLQWCHTTVRRTVTNPIYIGETYYGRRKRVGRTKVEMQDREKWTLLPSITPQIVDKATFEAVQELLKNKPRRLPNTHSDYFLTGFISCSDCGSPMCGATLNHKYRYYCCRGTRPTRTRGVICKARLVKAEEVEQYVWDRFSNLVSSPLTQLDLLTNLRHGALPASDMITIIDKQIKGLRNRLNTYETRERKLLAMLDSPAVTERYVLDAIANLRKQQQDDQQEMNRLEALRTQRTRVIRATESLTNLCDAVAQAMRKPLTVADRRKWLEAYNVKITAAPGKYIFTTAMHFTSEDWDPQLEELTRQELKGLESRHPDIVCLDWADYNVMLPQEGALAETSNDMKRQYLAQQSNKRPVPSTDRSYITIGQTWAL